MRMLLLFSALILSPLLSAAEAGWGASRYGDNSRQASRYAHSYNRTDYANVGRVQYYQSSRYSYQPIGGYITTTRYPDSWWGPSNPSYSAGYRLGRTLRGR